jgi:hypothetical protein
MDVITSIVFFMTMLFYVVDSNSIFYLDKRSIYSFSAGYGTDLTHQ